MRIHTNEDYSINKKFPINIITNYHGPGETYNVHSHEFIELIYVVSGECYHTYKGKSSQLCEGDICIIKPGEVHGYRTENNTTMKTYLILFQPEVLQKELFVLSDLEDIMDYFYLQMFFRKDYEFKDKMTLTPLEKIRIDLLVKTVKEELENKELGHELLIKTKLIELFIFLSRVYEKHKKTFKRNTNEDYLIIDWIIEFIQYHYSKAISLEQISRLAGMSNSTFTSKFKQQTGTNFIDYRNDIRIKAAKHLLITTNKKVIDISNEVGFLDISNFNKVFKRKTGFSPKAYKKQLP
ncbi:AraC family transcriptional regulator [Listeria monocytogenes]|nr:AraC family transcriptional regulator [Listeria monocytogenes]